MDILELNRILAFINAFTERNDGKDYTIINHLFKIEFNTFLDDGNFSEEIIKDFKLS